MEGSGRGGSRLEPVRGGRLHRGSFKLSGRQNTRFGFLRNLSSPYRPFPRKMRGSRRGVEVPAVPGPKDHTGAIVPGRGSSTQDGESPSDLDTRPGERILDGDELLPDLGKLIVKVLPGIAPEPGNLFFRLPADLEHLVLLVQHPILLP